MLTERVEQYVALRRATGFKFLDSERLLRGFARCAAERGEEHIRAATAVAWATEARSQSERHRRLRLVTRLAQFIRVEDPHHEIPPQDVFYARAVRPAPHIYSEQDVAKIVGYAAKLGPPGSLRPLTYSTMFGLMAVAGLRRGEALELRISDFTGDGLLIRATKFRKSRFTPLHETTITQLEHYLEARRRVAGQTDHLFVSLHRRQFSPHTVLRTFHEVCEQAGIGRTVAGTRPRLQDLRHTFAVRALERCPAGRDQVNRHMLALTTYMGHACVESTYWYLERTPQLLRDIANACDTLVAGGGA
ncbi:MAG TPA: tyrosine-type recombinase/integrase [Thermoleophilia bacterium]|nr:tyrosine-type recombinase/integrase [Thermoleophilia bacterium]